MSLRYAFDTLIAAIRPAGLRWSLLALSLLNPGCGDQEKKAGIPAENKEKSVLTTGTGDDGSGKSATRSGDQEFWVTLSEAKMQASESGKYILLDVYTEWCGFCRRMNRETYNDSRVRENLGRYFHAVRVDAESDETVAFQGNPYTMSELAYGMGVTSYPTTVFLNPAGEPVAVQPGFIPADTFHIILSYVGSESYKTLSFDQYKKRNPSIE